MSPTTTSTSESDFHWLPEYDTLLEDIASTDVVNTEWNQLRDVIKYKIDKNISLFLSESHQSIPPPTFEPVSLPTGGLRLPPFPPRKSNQIHMNEVPVSHLDEKGANEMKDFIFQQLHEFDQNPPFTIQRVCELCMHPMLNYNSIGKYLRAVEKSLLVTSTWDSFPVPAENDLGLVERNVHTMSSASQSVPATPLFSPIPFLHDDARRSKSRSPPPSPLALSTAGPGHPEALETKALGLVDELDDPSPGHMSDHPTALSSVTTVSDSPTPHPVGSLEQRFVKAEEPTLASEQAVEDKMVVDDDKENTKS